MFVLPDDDDVPDPTEVGADRVLPEKRHHPADWLRNRASDLANSQHFASSLAAGTV
jgi:hypothetical protein